MVYLVLLLAFVSAAVAMDTFVADLWCCGVAGNARLEGKQKLNNMDRTPPP